MLTPIQFEFHNFSSLNFSLLVHNNYVLLFIATLAFCEAVRTNPFENKILTVYVISQFFYSQMHALIDRNIEIVKIAAAGTVKMGMILCRSIIAVYRGGNTQCASFLN
jgi:hypothetical protein